MYGKVSCTTKPRANVESEKVGGWGTGGVTFSRKRLSYVPWLVDFFQVFACSHQEKRPSFNKGTTCTERKGINRHSMRE